VFDPNFLCIVNQQFVSVAEPLQPVPEEVIMLRFGIERVPEAVFGITISLSR